jgi:hypothetical protein
MTSLKRKKGFGSKMISLIMSVVVAWGCMVPPAAFADTGDTTSSSDDSAATTLDEGTSTETRESLNAAWTSTGNDFTVPAGDHTYYLESDLTVTASMYVSTVGQNVTIDLNGHTLSFQSPSATERGDASLYLGIEQDSSDIPPNLSIVDTSEQGGGTLRFHDSGGVRLYPAAGALSLKDISVVKDYEAADV